MNKRNGKLSYLIIAAVCIVVGNIFVISYLSAEKNIYYWDVSGYWIQCIDFTKLLFSDAPAAMDALYNSILTSDYNLLPVLPLSLVAQMLSHSHNVFVLAVYNLYAIPFICLAIRFIRRLMLDNGNFSNAKLILSAAVCMLCTAALTPLLGGYIDIVGLMFAVLICIILYKHGFGMKTAWIIVLLLVILSLLRRWYLFWVVAFFPAAGAAYLVRCLSDKEYSWKAFMLDMIKLASIGVGYVAVMLVCFREFFVRALTNNFADIYKAYRGDGLLSEIVRVVRGIGPVFVVLAIIGLALLIIKKRTRVLAVFLAVQSVVIFVLFTRMQAFGVQHLYLFVPAAVVLAAAGVVMGMDYIRRRSVRMCICAALAGLLMFSFMYVYLPFDSALSPVMPSIRRAPRVMASYETILDITEYLNMQTDGKNELVYVVASSDRLNDEILANAHLPQVRYSVNGLTFTHHIDLRDGFPNHFFMADIVVVGELVQTHMRAEDQQVVGILAEKILSGDAVNLELLKTFTLEPDKDDEAVLVHIYKRSGAYSAAFAADIASALKTSYPDKPELYDVNYFYAMMDKGQVRLNEHGEIYYNPSGDVLVTAKTEQNVGFVFDNQRQFATLRFEIAENTDVPMTLTILDGEEVIYSGDTSVKTQVVLDIANSDRLEFVAAKADAGPGWGHLVIGGIELER